MPACELRVVGEEDLSSDSLVHIPAGVKTSALPAVGAHTFLPSARETERSRQSSVSLRPTWSTQ